MKKRNCLKLLLIAALVLITILSVTACGEEKKEKTKVEGNYLDNLPSDLDFGGEKINVYYWDTEFLRNELTADGTTADVVDVAVYQRNLSVEERLNVEMNYIAGDVAAEYFMPAARDIIMSGSTELDVIVSPYYEAPKVAQEGAFLDLADAKYIDYDAVYWNQDYNDALSINNKKFMLAGDISLSTIKSCATMTFDLERFEATFGDPQQLYDLVLEGDGNKGGWTYDALNDYCRQSYVDLNGNSQYDNGDQYGFSMSGTSSTVDLFAYSAGVQWSHRDENNVPVIDMNTEKFYDFFADFYKLCYENEGVHLRSSTLSEEVEIEAVFNPTIMHDLVDMRAEERDFGVIPFPKYYEYDTEYHALTGPYVFSVPITAPTDRVDMITAWLECMASEGHRLCLPAYYEKALKNKYTRDDVSVKMLDIIHDGATTDFMNVYGECMISIGACFRQLIGYDEPNFMSWYAAKEPTVNKKLVELLEAFDENTSNINFTPETTEQVSDEELEEERIGDNQISTHWATFGTKYRKSLKYFKPDWSEEFAYVINDDDQIEVRSPSMKVAGGYFPTAAIQSRGKIPLNDLSFNFKVDEGFTFEHESDSYAGAVSVGWTTEPLSGIPEYLDGIGTNGFRACIPTGVEAYSLVVSFLGSADTTGTIADYLYIILFDGTDPCVEVDNRIGLRFTNKVQIDLSEPCKVEIREDDELGFVVVVNDVEYRTGMRGEEELPIDLTALREKMDEGHIFIGAESPGATYSNFTLMDINGKEAGNFFN